MGQLAKCIKLTARTNMIPCQRHLFEIPDEVAYFNCAYMSPLMHTVRDAGLTAVARKVTPWHMRPDDFFPQVHQAKALFAQLINATPADIALVPSASYGLNVAATNLPINAHEKILVLEEQFPSNIYCWQELARRTDAKLLTVPAPADNDWTSAILRHLTPDVAIAALPHILWTDGSRLNLVKIAAQLRAQGTKLALDVTQSLGALPLDVQAIKPDFLACATYKWLLGPYSCGFLYVAPQWQDGIPLEHNWINRKGSEDFSSLVDYQSEFQPGAERFDMGERANFALLPMVVAALQQILQWTPDAIQQSLSQVTATIAAKGQEMGLSSVPPEFRAGHFLGLRFADGIPGNLLARMAEDNIYASVRGSSLRITPHLFNNEADIDRLFRLLEKKI